MYRTLARRLKKIAEKVAVESANRQPFGATRSAGNDIDVFGPKTSLPDESTSARSRAQRQG